MLLANYSNFHLIIDEIPKFFDEWCVLEPISFKIHTVHTKKTNVMLDYGLNL